MCLSALLAVGLRVDTISTQLWPRKWTAVAVSTVLHGDLGCMSTSIMYAVAYVIYCSPECKKSTGGSNMSGKIQHWNAPRNNQILLHITFGEPI